MAIGAPILLNILKTYTVHIFKKLGCAKTWNGWDGWQFFTLLSLHVAYCVSLLITMIHMMRVEVL